MKQTAIKKEIKKELTSVETPTEVKDEIIDKTFVMKDNLRDWIFKEDSKGRYRERIIKLLEEIGVENWFKLKGYPTNSDSVWKNRCTGSLITLEEDIHRFDNENRKGNLQEKGYYLWENNLPIEIWNDKDMNESHKKGTKEFYERKEEERANDKKYNRKSQEQTSLFEVKEKPKEIVEVKEEINYEEEFKKLDLPNGFKDLKENYRFYSETTGVEEVRKDRVLAVLEKDRIQTCDEFGCFEHCFGITEEFANELIKELKLVEKEEKGTWINPKIKQDENSKKIAELKKELAVRKAEMMDKIKEIRELENEI